MPEAITISQGLAWLKTLNERHGELVSLRNQNSARNTVHYGANADKHQTIEPKYDVVELDKLITRVAREIRVLNESIRHTNETVKVKGYERNDDVLGELSPSSN